MDSFASEEFWTALEQRHDELIARLDALNAVIEAALAEIEGAETAQQAPQAA